MAWVVSTTADAGGPQAADQRPRLASHMRVETSGGLVQEDQLGTSDDRPGEVDELLLAAGQSAVGGVGEASRPRVAISSAGAGAVAYRHAR